MAEDLFDPCHPEASQPILVSDRQHLETAIRSMLQQTSEAPTTLTQA